MQQQNQDSARREVDRFNPVTLAVAVCTYHRPEALRKTLRALFDQKIRYADACVHVVVIDNGTSSHSSGTLASMSEGLPEAWKLSYVHEPIPGVSSARNTALDSAFSSLGCDYVIFLDDDEIPTPKWLQSFIQMQDAKAADIVAGPVLPLFPPGAPLWSSDSKIFSRQRHLTGTRVRLAGGGNLLITRRVFERGLRFDAIFGLTGGEDTDFLMRAHEAGFQVIWSDEAVVLEELTISRMRPTDVWRRAYRDGLNYSRALKRLEGTKAYPDRVLGTIKAFAIGITFLLTCFLSWPGRAIRGIQQLALGLGFALGLSGIQSKHWASERT